ncbi:MAG: hypothetical protein F6K41_38255 [Symploca sp. SIO3E6]|nr:hypothetical protein [Caldora sp. SIO3E6]
MITPLTTLRKFTPVVLGLALCGTTLGCQPNNTYQVPRQPRANTVSTQVRLANGNYPLKQATYNDANGQYTLFLFNGTPPVFSTTNLQMMPLTAVETKTGKQSYLQMQNNQAILHLSPDFQIEYIHAVTEQVNGAENVIVRRESTYWEPFEDDDELEIEIDFNYHQPYYYVPPVYQRGVILGRGYYAPTYQQAVAKYEQNHKTQPPAVKNNRLRTSGELRKSTATKTQPTTNNRATTTTAQPKTNNRATTTTAQPKTNNRATTTTAQPKTNNRATTTTAQPKTNNRATTTTAQPTTNNRATTKAAPLSSDTKATGSGYSNSNLKKSNQTKQKSKASKKSSSSFGSNKSSRSKSSSSSKKR